MPFSCIMHLWQDLRDFHPAPKAAAGSLQDLVLVRLSCLARVQDEKEYLQLRTSWDALKARERSVLTDHFLADGIQDGFP